MSFHTPLHNLPPIRRSGMTIISDGGKSSVDIVFVHGLNGDPRKTWTHARSNFFWPWELSKHVDGLRVMIYGYDADISPQYGTNLIRIKALAESFLSSLVNERQDNNESERPLVFVAHSLGGLVIKKALTLASQAVVTEADDAHQIYKSTKGLMFFGTPNAGSAVDKKKRVWLLKTIAKVAFTEVPPKIDSALELHSDELLDLADDFRKTSIYILKQIQIYTYYETYTVAKLGDVVVDEFSACVGYDKEVKIPIQADHEDMVKFKDEDDADYRNVWGKIRIMTRKAVNTTEVPDRPVTVNSLAAGFNRSSAPWTLEDIVKKASDQHKEEAGKLLLQSLDFCERNDRVSSIATACEKTFEWIFSHNQAASQPIDNFVVWLKSSTNQQQIYWIQGKAGSGKSTLMAFLDSRLREILVNIDSNGWTANSHILQASCYFWHGGTKAQRSLGGLLQSLVYQLCLRHPKALLTLVNKQRQEEALLQVTRRTTWANDMRYGSDSFLGHVNIPLPALLVPWTLSELKTCLSKLLQTPHIFAESAGLPYKFLLLIDGLDEYDGPDEEIEGMLSLLFSFSRSSTVKLCLSSRPWMIFKVFFSNCPQLRLETLTQKDIEVFVTQKLSRDKFFQQMEMRTPKLISDIKIEIIRKADGVFLWVRLVVHDLLRLARDGCKTPQLLKLLDTLPPDLDDLFMRMMRSVNPLYQEEASILMQIALCKLDWQHEVVGDYREEKSFDGPPLDLLHLCGDEIRPDFVTSRGSIQSLNWSDQVEIRYWLETLDRLLASRCMGLLEWHASEPLNAFVPRKISFLHRTVRSFLLTPNAQRVLLEFSGGQYDARLFRCNALVFDVMGLSNLPPSRSSHLVRLNNLSCFLGQISQLQSEEKVYSLYDTFLSTIRVSESDWKQLNRDVENEYITNAPGLLLEATGEWNKDQSTALSLAILLGWTDYVKARLTYEMISEKTGRPLLDYALVPCTRLSKNAHPEIVAHLLLFGADPSELYQGTSLWVRHILSLQDLDHCDRVSTFITIETLIRHGVDRFVRISDLQAEPSNEKIQILRVTTLQEMLLHYETHRPAGFDEDAYDVLDVLEAISRSRHWAHAFEFEMKERTRLEKIWSGEPLHSN